MSHHVCSSKFFDGLHSRGLRLPDVVSRHTSCDSVSSAKRRFACPRKKAVRPQRMTMKRMVVWAQRRPCWQDLCIQDISEEEGRVGLKGTEHISGVVVRSKLSRKDKDEL